MNIGSLILLLVTAVMLIFAYTSYIDNKQFKLWYTELLKKAPYYGFTEDKIEEFEMGVFWNYYSEEMSPEDALKTYLLED